MTELVAIDLTWFRQFENERLEFGRDPGRPIVLIEGRNGYGKTHLVEAMRFALQNERRSDLDELLHEYVPQELDEATVAVVVELDSSSDGRVRVRRAVSFRRGADGSWRRTSRPALTVEAATLDQPIQDAHADDWLAQRFPPEVLDYFIFDAESTVVQKLSGQRGERLPDVRLQVEAAIGVRPIRALTKRCREIAADWESRAGEPETAASAGALEAAAAAASEQAERVESRLADLRKERGQREGELTQLTERLRGLEPEPGASGVREELERAEAELALHLDLLRRSLDEDLPLALLADPVSDLLTSIGNDQRWRDHPERARGAREAAQEIARAVTSGRFPWAAASGREAVLGELLDLLGLDGDDKREELHELHRRAVAARGRLSHPVDLDLVTAV